MLFSACRCLHSRIYVACSSAPESTHMNTYCTGKVCAWQQVEGICGLKLAPTEYRGSFLTKRGRRCQPLQTKSCIAKELQRVQTVLAHRYTSLGSSTSSCSPGDQKRICSWMDCKQTQVGTKQGSTTALLPYPTQISWVKGPWAHLVLADPCEEQLTSCSQLSHRTSSVLTLLPLVG